MIASVFLHQLNQLSRWQQMAFICALAQRMSPNYQLFSETTGFAVSTDFRKYLELFWEYLGSSKSRVNFEVQQVQFDELIPDPQQFEMYGVYPALDACVVLSVLFNSVVSPDGEEASQASQTSMATVVGFIEMQLGELDEDELAKQELVQDEIAYQNELLRLVQGFEKNSPQLKSIKNHGRHGDISNIGISLND